MGKTDSMKTNPKLTRNQSVKIAKLRERLVIKKMAETTSKIMYTVAGFTKEQQRKIIGAAQILSG